MDTPPGSGVSHGSELEPGPAALAWFNAVRRDANLRTAWRLSDPVYRLARAQAWLYNNRMQADLRALDLKAIAIDFAMQGCSLPLWDEFAQSELTAMHRAWAHWVPGRMGYFTAPRPTEVDYELILLTDGRDGTQFNQPTVAMALPFLMHLVEEGWLVANVGSDAHPEPGWPPAFPESRFAAN